MITIASIPTAQIKSVKGDTVSLTASEVKYIKQGLSQGLSHFKSPRKTFEITGIIDNSIHIKCSEYRSDDWGRKILEVTKGTVTLKK